MAGVKGRSGGARPNTGGARPGAGRKPAPPQFLPEVSASADPKAFLLAVMDDPTADVKVRLDAAKVLMPFLHQKIGEGGKKEAKADAAKKASTGRFAAAAAPKLVVNNK